MSPSDTPPESEQQVSVVRHVAVRDDQGRQCLELEAVGGLVTLRRVGQSRGRVRLTDLRQAVDLLTEPE